MPKNVAMLPRAPETQWPSGSFATSPRTSTARPTRSLMKKRSGRAIRRPNSRRFRNLDTHGEPGPYQLSVTAQIDGFTCAKEVLPGRREGGSVWLKKRRQYPRGVRIICGSQSKLPAWRSGHGKWMTIVSQWTNAGSTYGVYLGASKSPLNNYQRIFTRQTGTEFALRSTLPARLPDRMKSTSASWLAMTSAGSRRAVEVPTRGSLIG